METQDLLIGLFIASCFAFTALAISYSLSKHSFHLHCSLQDLRKEMERSNFIANEMLILMQNRNN